MNKIAVLLSSYNGEKYIHEQIESILNQSLVDVSLLIRDDGSTDKTISIIQNMIRHHDNIYIVKGENVGYKKSFLTLCDIFLQHPQFRDINYFAFADQDDVWLSEKLSRGIEAIGSQDSQPALYYSALRMVDARLHNIGTRKYTESQDDFKFSMYSCGVAGCTFVSTRNLLMGFMRDFPELPNGIVGHDTALFRYAEFINSKIVRDDESYILFRRHGDNASSGGNNVWVKLKKAKTVILFSNNENSKFAQRLLELPIEYSTSYTRNVAAHAASYNSNFLTKIGYCFRASAENFPKKLMIQISILAGNY